MSVRVRLTRVGSKKNPVWRVVVADQRSPRDGRIIESIGHYNPQTQPSTIVIDRERLQHWIEKGAQPTNTVRKLMRAPDTTAESVATESPIAAPPPGPPAPEEAGSEAPDSAEAPETAGAPEEAAEAPEAAAAPEAGVAPEEAAEAPEAPTEGETAPAGTAGSDSEPGPSGAAVEAADAEPSADAPPADS